MKQYLAEKSCEVVKARNEANMLAKNVNKEMKLSKFSYWMGETKGIKVDQEEGKEKYVVPNSLPRSPLSKIFEDEKFSLFSVDVEDKGTLEDDPTPFVATPLVTSTAEPANPLVELGRLMWSFWIPHLIGDFSITAKCNFYYICLYRL